jgi:hypothetical protein
MIHDFPQIIRIRDKFKISINLNEMERMEGNLKRGTAGAGEIVEMNRFDGNKRKEFPEEEEQKKVKQNREKKEQWRKEKSKYEKKRK